MMIAIIAADTRANAVDIVDRVDNLDTALALIGALSEERRDKQFSAWPFGDSYPLATAVAGRVEMHSSASTVMH